MNRLSRALFSASALCIAATVPATGQQAPQFDARPGCLAGAASGVSNRPDVDACMQSEQRARDEMNAQWDKFAAGDKTRCVAKTHMGGPPSYIEVLTCLELALAARDIPKDDNTGLSRGLRPR